MKLKLDDQGNAVLKDGMPVYIHDDGSESPFDVAATVRSIAARAEQSQRVEARAKAAEEKLKAFDGLDPESARTALDKVSKLDAKKLLEAGQVDAAISAALKPVQDQLAAAQAELSSTRDGWHGEKIGSAFKGSKFITEKTILPADLAQAKFGGNFKVEDGKLKGYDENGQPIFSRKNPGAPADFDEAMEFLVDRYERKDQILRAENTPGSGAPPPSGARGIVNKKAAQMTDAEKGLFIREKGLPAWNEKLSAEK